MDLSQSALNVFGDNKNSLVYESLLHVALTRQKHHLHIFYKYENDEIGNRLNECAQNQLTEKKIILG